MSAVSEARTAVFAAELDYHRPHPSEEAKEEAWAKRITTLNAFEREVAAAAAGELEQLRERTAVDAARAHRAEARVAQLEADVERLTRMLGTRTAAEPLPDMLSYLATAARAYLDALDLHENIPEGSDEKWKSAAVVDGLEAELQAALATVESEP